MARKRQKTVEMFETEQPEAVVPADKQDSSAEPTTKTILLKVGSDGKVDLNRMRSETRQLFLRAIENLKTPIEQKKTEVSLLITPLYKLLGSLESAIVSWRTKRPYEDIEKIFTYTDQEIELLRKPTSAVLAKRLPEQFKYTDEVALLFLLIGIHQQKVLAFKEYMEISDKKTEESKKTE